MLCQRLPKLHAIYLIPNPPSKGDSVVERRIRGRHPRFFVLHQGRSETKRDQQWPLGAPMVAYSGCGERVGGAFGWPDGGSVADGRSQAGSGMARSRARARLNWVSHGQRRGRCRVNRRAERVSRPARAKTRRRRVLVVTVRSPRPIRAVQRARLCAITCSASQTALAAKCPEGRWFSPTPYLRSRIAFSTSAWRRRGPVGNRAWASPAGR